MQFMNRFDGRLYTQDQVKSHLANHPEDFALFSALQPWREEGGEWLRTWAGDMVICLAQALCDHYGLASYTVASDGLVTLQWAKEEDLQ